MTDEPRSSLPQKPKSLLETHRDAGVLIQALNEYAAIHQKPVSRDMMSDLSLSSSCASLRVSFQKSTLPDPPESLTQGSDQDPNLVASASANPHVNDKQKENPFVKEPTGPLVALRRQPVLSEQPSVSKLLEFGVKVRDFAYESTLPPVPTVYLQPRQIQPSVPKDVNDPNDLHYVLEEERKKKAYSFESTRKIQRTPTEPMLESDCALPVHRTFPKIKRTDALLDFSSQPDSQPQSQPMPSYPALPYNITNTPQSTSQPIPGLTLDSQLTEPWVDTPIMTPNGSAQWPENPTYTTSTAILTAPKVAISSAHIPRASFQMNSITTSDSQLPPEPETMSYFQMGFMHPDSQTPILNGSAVEALMPKSQSHDPSSSAIQGSSPKWTPTDASRRAEPNDEPLAPLAPSPSSSHTSRPASSARSTLRSPSFPTAGLSRLTSRPPLPTPAPPSAPTSPRYSLRNRNKRCAKSPPPISPDRHLPSRQRTTHSRIVLSPGTATEKTMRVASINSAHLQNKADPGIVSTGRTLKRPRESNGDAKADGSPSALGDETSRKRRNKP